MPLQIKETFINESKGHIFSESGWYTPFTEDRGELFRSLRGEYGRCTSSVYIDRVNAPPVRVGWVFTKRMEYEDYRPGSSMDRYYTREVWVSTREVKQLD